MGKSLFVENVSTTAIQGKGINASKVMDVIGAKVANGDLVALLPGDQFVDSFEGYEYVTHQVAIFDSELCPLTKDLLAKSQHSHATYGECTGDMPKVGTKDSAKGHKVPDMDMVNTTAGFRFKAEVVGKDAEGNDLINLKVEHLQLFKVEGFKYYWEAVYDNTTKDVIVVDDESGEQYCKMRKRRKPNFVPAKLSSKQKEKVMAALREAGYISAE